MAPPLVPAIRSIGIPPSTSALMAPMCVTDRAVPPLSAMPTGSKLPVTLSLSVRLDAFSKSIVRHQGASMKVKTRVGWSASVGGATRRRRPMLCSELQQQAGFDLGTSERLIGEDATESSFTVNRKWDHRSR